jgi:hypothetical protein
VGQAYIAHSVNPVYPKLNIKTPLAGQNKAEQYKYKKANDIGLL